MKVLLLLVGLLCAAASAGAQEIVTLQTRPGVTQSFYVGNMAKRKPEAVALLLVGGGGSIRLRQEGGEIKFATGNFLPRSRSAFIRNRVLPVILDAPSDQQPTGMSDNFRRGAEHTADVRAVLAEISKRYPGLPVFVVGTSRGTISAANLAASLDREIAGVALTASMFYSGGKNYQPVLVGFNWAAIKVPVLLVHHFDDACSATPYQEAERLSKRSAFPLITVKGGKPNQSGVCEPLSAHGFYGMESQTVDAIAAWMLGKPFAKDIQ